MSRECGGRGLCGKCRVMAPAWPVDPADRRVLGDDCDKGWRLACIHEKAIDALKENIMAAGSDLESSELPAIYGALDIGTTTVVLVLLDEAGRKVKEFHWANPQRPWGADVISRIEHFNEIPPHLVNDLVMPHVQGLKRLVITGNTVMTHLWLGVDPGPLARVPFTIPYPEQVVRVSQWCEEVVCAPFAPYVGADIRTGLAQLLSGPHAGRFLYMDLGTNGELAWYDHGHLTVCSTAGGPALEGAGITIGMAALPGAIDRVGPDWQAHVIGDIPASGVCGSGLFSWIDRLLSKKLVTPAGRLKDHPAVCGLHLCQKDVRMFQLAKGALQAGWQLLVPDPSCVEEVWIAGGFSLGLDVEACVRLGLFHESWQGKVKLCGNMALKGACRQAVTGIADDLRADVLWLEKDPRFAQAFAQAMLLKETV